MCSTKVKAEKLTAYEDKVSDEPLIAEQPKAGTIVKTEEGPFGSTVLTFIKRCTCHLENNRFQKQTKFVCAHSVPVVTPCSPTMKFFR